MRALRLLVSLIFGLAGSATTCRANLGDTLAKCESRFGPAVPGQDSPDPSGVGDIMLTFQSRGYNIRVILVAGHAAGECFAKMDGSALSDADKSLLLKNESAGWAWARSTSTVGENWLRTDGAVATYAPQYHSLILETAPYLTAVKTKQAAHP